MTRPTLGQFLRAWAGEATRRGQKLLVLRNYHALPETNVGKDMDLLVRAGAVPELTRSLRAICARLHVSAGLDRRRFDCRQYVVRTLAGGDLKVDFIDRLHWRGVQWLSADEVVRRARPFRDGIWVPHPADECVITFCHSYLYGGFVKAKYLDSMSRQAAEHRTEVAERLSGIFGRRRARRIADALASRQIGPVQDAATTNRLLALLRGLVHNPAKFICTSAAGWWVNRRRSA